MPRRKRNSSQTARPVERPARRRLGGKSENPRAAAPARKKALPPTGGDSSSDDEEDNRAAAVDAPANEAPVHAPFKAPDPTRTVLFDDDDDDDAAPPPPGSPRCVVCSTTRDVFIVERAPVWKSTSVGHDVVVLAPRRQAIELASRRWRGGRRAKAPRSVDFSTQAGAGFAPRGVLRVVLLELRAEIRQAAARPQGALLRHGRRRAAQPHEAHAAQLLRRHRRRPNGAGAYLTLTQRKCHKKTYT